MRETIDLTYYVGAFVDELVKSGVEEAVISPGSRSTPLAIMMAEHAKLKVTVLIDERSASFYALGLAKTAKKPVAILCTSGTAATNYYPAIVEAHYSRLPLIVITADRPHELRDVGAPQAIDQIKMYGNYVKWFAEMSLPSSEKKHIQYVRTVAARATGTALSSPVGPVHLNFPFRDPLVPDLQLPDLWTHENELEISIMETKIGSYTISDQEARKFATMFSTKQKGLIVCGEMNSSRDYRNEVVQLSKNLNFPILADPLSQLRSGLHETDAIIETYDALFKNEEVVRSLKPEVIIRFGAMPVSKFLTQYIQKANCVQIVVDGDGGWRDPTLEATHMVHCDERTFCNSVLQLLEEKANNRDWLHQFQRINTQAKKVLSRHLDDVSLFEGKVITELQTLLPQNAALFVGNSMPIRDVDTFFYCDNKNITILANRGANGIDGIISTALAASNAFDQLVLVIGDLSFYHDMNGLLASKLLDLNITIVLVNNNGGGIFSFLPQSKVEQHFETLFGTPLHMDFAHAVKLYNGSYDKVETWSQFRDSVIRSFTQNGLKVIEIPTSRVENEQLHRKMWKNVSQEITCHE
ncbi:MULTISPECIES: 2-succinyl-5-enolpyruvyl-6-hydroxy-3-cyclohexene-1-carboxylic-acid synthase [Bacillus]|uniref:2-succinyl-5-enolpyruvyl-6-hydroxy-3- cyclohexene-1-carboxylic-acid synthase n=1 Tax=Bacillus TaxID=1386 RepID=UPI000BB8D3ED|nr:MULTISPECIES: 2-succinyl-5-enolpyruvyl-6-hydroxy-3-cyclohexene-1-carboxylic-acid synthase [Bacillus]